MDDPRRLVPRTDAVLADPRLAGEARRLGAARVKTAVAAALARCRAGELSPDDVVSHALDSLPAGAAGLRPVINATGVVVHTNLGRAPLSDAAREALLLAAGATDIEIDLATGQRGRRGRSAVAALARAVPDAEDVLVVNNGAAALSLVAHALAWQQEIVVARGELVEIGDGFRIPDLLEASGAQLREVGTTNRVRLDDYAAAITASTALVLKVHPSNFVVAGFTASVSVSELATLPVPLVVDIGSGLLAPHPRLPDEPEAGSTLRAGAALVTASGDKLLGGPQAGLVLGRSDLVRRMRRHPVARALRVDKLTLAALEATLDGPPSPVAAALSCVQDDLLARARAIRDHLADLVAADAVPTKAVVGGGGAPGVELASAAVALPATIAARLRTGQPAVLGHVAQGRLLLDLIAVDPSYDASIVDAVRLAVEE
jgi:L-seryl-tRNA(Ser) seleniumtransferase